MVSKNPMTKKVVFSLGDPSAEKILNALLPHLELKDWEFYAFTGNLLREKVHPLGRIEDISATGLFEIVPKLPKILKARRRLLNFLKREKPQILVAMDAPGFNLPLIKVAKELGVKRVIYFILPQIWAWKEKRKYILSRYADILISILPFEREYFMELKGAEFHFVGHPSVELLEDLEQLETPWGDYFVIFPAVGRTR
jgi:lipid-A-disaccharide synthase